MRLHWCRYGGLIREVTLHVLPKDGPSIERVSVNPLAKSTGEPNGQVNVTVALREPIPSKSVALMLCWDLPASSPPCASDAKQYTPASGLVTIPDLAVPKWGAWSPADAKPKLHLLTVFVHSDGDTSGATASIIDGIQVRFGLRTVRASGRHILINGKPTKLHGYNRHDMYPQLGPSLTDEIYDSDIQLLQGKLHGSESWPHTITRQSSLIKASLAVCFPPAV
eukprot:COSAG02_NODE_1041_length_15034_cov_96.398326_9_plen_223_part_00